MYVYCRISIAQYSTVHPPPSFCFYIYRTRKDEDCFIIILVISCIQIIIAWLFVGNGEALDH